MSAPSLRELSFRAPGCLFCSPHTRASPISIKPAPALASPLRTLDISGDHLNLLLRHAWFNLLHLRKLCIATPNNQLYSLVAELLEISDDMVAFRWDFPVWTYFHSWRPCPIKFPRNLRLLVFTLGNSDTLCTTLDLIAESAVMPPSIEQIVLVGHTLARAMGDA
ncbi:hypothetical protein DXG03_001774 [Asterophora parasitica]|uniref:Uncharacterized protein n=1 Tax=Asterophora parasitica TaxID=117018 RepID=A0A9P7G979_9AGAR|nr:hypothetical protein DXG03_001774 [Asterophora parasitica]